MEKNKTTSELVDCNMISRDFPGGAVVKNPPANAVDNAVQSLVQEDPTCHGATKPMSHD